MADNLRFTLNKIKGWVDECFNYVFTSIRLITCWKNTQVQPNKVPGLPTLIVRFNPSSFNPTYFNVNEKKSLTGKHNLKQKLFEDRNFVKYNDMLRKLTFCKLKIWTFKKLEIEFQVKFRQYFNDGYIFYRTNRKVTYSAENWKAASVNGSSNISIKRRELIFENWKFKWKMIWLRP